ncbi:insulinase family protein [Nocardia sp. NPDC060256]|uniref:insulinase family protein n=1 Tax=unclassified Nocardia TaxID=2637762 RepID=UPI0036674517
MSTPLRKLPSPRGIRLLKGPARASGYEVARIVWHLDAGAVSDGDRGVPLVALEALLRSPVAGARRTTLADRAEALGVRIEPGLTHLSCYCDVRGPRDSVRAIVPVLTASIGAAGITDEAARAARVTVAAGIGERERSLADHAQRALYSAFVGPDGWLGAHSAGTVESVALIDRVRAESAARDLASAPAISVLFSDDVAGDLWCAELAGLVAATDQPGVLESVNILRGQPSSRIERHLRGPRGSHLLWGCVTGVDGVADQVALEIATHALGGTTTARWQRLFREQLRYTYGMTATCRIIRVGTREYGLVTLGTALIDADRAAVIELLDRQVRRLLADGLTPDECASSARQLLAAEPLGAVSARIFVARAAQPIQNGLDPANAAQRLDCLAAADPDDVNDRLGRLMETTVIASVVGEVSST